MAPLGQVLDRHNLLTYYDSPDEAKQLAVAIANQLASAGARDIGLKNLEAVLENAADGKNIDRFVCDFVEEAGARGLRLPAELVGAMGGFLETSEPDARGSEILANSLALAKLRTPVANNRVMLPPAKPVSHLQQSATATALGLRIVDLAHKDRDEEINKLLAHLVDKDPRFAGEVLLAAISSYENDFPLYDPDGGGLLAIGARFLDTPELVEGFRGWMRGGTVLLERLKLMGRGGDRKPLQAFAVALMGTAKPNQLTSSQRWQLAHLLVVATESRPEEIAQLARDQKISEGWMRVAEDTIVKDLVYDGLVGVYGAKGIDAPLKSLGLTTSQLERVSIAGTSPGEY